MAKAEANRVQVAFIREVTFGETPPTPEMDITRFTSSSFAANKQTVTSEEIRSDRMVSDQPEVGFDNNGTLQVEYSGGGTYSDFIESALCGTYSTPISVSGAMTTTAPNAVSSGALGAFTGMVAGDFFYLSGDWTDQDNVGWYKILTWSDADNVTVRETVTTDSATAGTVASKTLVNGVIQRSYAVEQGFLDIIQYMLFNGMRLGTMEVNVSAGEILNGSFGFQGTEVNAGATPYAASYDPATPTTTPVLNATSNVGQIYKDDFALLTCIRSIQFTLDNNLRSQMCVGNKFPSGIGYGRQTISGTLEAYFENLDLYNEMLNHEDVSLEFSVFDIDGRGVHFEFPRVKFNTDAPSPEGVDTDVMENIEWTAIANDAGTYQIRITSTE